MYRCPRKQHAMSDVCMCLTFLNVNRSPAVVLFPPENLFSKFLFFLQESAKKKKKKSDCTPGLLSLKSKRRRRSRRVVRVTSCRTGCPFTCRDHTQTSLPFILESRQTVRRRVTEEGEKESGKKLSSPVSSFQPNTWAERKSGQSLETFSKSAGNSFQSVFLSFPPPGICKVSNWCLFCINLVATI